MAGCERYIELISAGLDGELSQSESAELEEHLKNCPDCRKVREAFSAISQELSLELREPPEELARGVMSRIEARKKPKMVNIWWRYAAAAACVGVVLLSAWGLIPRMASERSAGSGAADMAAAPAGEEAAANINTASGGADAGSAKIEENGGFGGAPAAVEAPAEEASADFPDLESDIPQPMESRAIESVKGTDSARELTELLDELFKREVPEVYDGGTDLMELEDSQPLFANNSESSEELRQLMGAVIAESDAEPPEESPDYILSFSGWTISLWVQGERITVLMSGEEEDVVFHVDGLPSEFLSFLESRE